ncbi:GNAT family N-acetyltransferase [Candidatus Woesearchaeota archaeon]|nr:GNAT family N-acetyltransferase [Candidatus Woesearchaeota archaeon]
MDIDTIVHEEFSKMSLWMPLDAILVSQMEQQCRVYYWTIKGQRPEETLYPGGYNFILDYKRNESYHGFIFLPDFLRGRGYGRELVEARIRICKRTGMKKMIIESTNHSFWKHMGAKKKRGCIYEIGL